MRMVSFWVGLDGMKTVLNEILEDTSAKELLAFSSVDDLFELLGKDFTAFVKKRVAKGLPSRVILRESERAWERVRLEKQELRHVRLIPPSYEHHGLMHIWGNRVALSSLKHEWIVLIIESEEVARTMKMIFEALWDSLPVPQLH